MPTSARGWMDAVSWHVRGLFASERNRRIGYRVRDLWQPAEVETRRGLAQDLATELSPELRIDKAAGYRMLPAAAIPSLDRVCSIGRSIIDDHRDADGELAAGKKFTRFRIANDEERLALLRVALDRRLLAMAAAYLGVFPVVTEADFYCAFATDANFTKSQLWHCDDDASDVIKVFVYCEDVTGADGPFELIQPVAARRIRDAIGYRYAGRRYRVRDDEMDRQLRPGEQTTIIGPRGSAFVVDTGKCFHRGSRIVERGRRRIAATFCYCPPSSTTLPRRLVSSDAPLVRFASNFDGYLERAALGLPTSTKWI